MNPDDSYLELARAIDRILARSVGVTAEVAQFAESSLGVGSSSELIDLLLQGEPDDRALLLELLIFPDETTQIPLEPLIERLAPEADPQARLLALLERLGPQLHLQLTESSPEIHLPLPTQALKAYISRLHLDRCLDRATLVSIEETLPRHQADAVKVAIRNHNLPLDPTPRELLRRFLHTLNSVDQEAMACLTRLLQMLELTPPPGDYYPVLAKQKHLLMGELRRWEYFERQHSRLPMESLLLRGLQPPAMTRETLSRELIHIDRLCMALYGKIEESVPPQRVEHPHRSRGQALK